MSDAVALTDCIGNYLHSQGPKPNPHLDWKQISELLLKDKQLSWPPDACCELWKYLAYGVWVKREHAMSYESDEDEFYFSPEQAEFKFRQHPTSHTQSEPNIGFPREIPRKVRHTTSYVFVYVYVYMNKPLCSY